MGLQRAGRLSCVSPTWKTFPYRRAKSKLRGLGQKLDATLKVGKDGLTPTFITELSRALRSHDLIKLRFVGESDRTARAALTTEIEAAGHCTCVGAVGATALFTSPPAIPPSPRCPSPDFDPAAGRTYSRASFCRKI